MFASRSHRQRFIVPSAAAVQRYVLTFAAGAAACPCLRPLEHLWPGTHGSRRRWVPRSPAQHGLGGCVRFGCSTRRPHRPACRYPPAGTTPKAVVPLHATCCKAAERALSLLLPLRRCSSVLAALSHAHSLPVAPSAAHAPFKSQSEPSVPVGVCPRPHQRACWFPGGARAGGHTEQLGCNPALQERAGTHASSLAWPERSGRL